MSFFSNPSQRRCTRYNIMWKCLSVTRSVAFSKHSDFFHTKKQKKTYHHDIIEILLNVASNGSQLGPRLKDPVLELYTLGCSSTHGNSLQVLQRTALDPAPHKADLGPYHIQMKPRSLVSRYSSPLFRYDCLFTQSAEKMNCF